MQIQHTAVDVLGLADGGAFVLEARGTASSRGVGRHCDCLDLIYTIKEDSAECCKVSRELRMRSLSVFAALSSNKFPTLPLIPFFVLVPEPSLSPSNRPTGIRCVHMSMLLLR